MKKQLIFPILALIIAGFACSIQNVQMETIDTQIVQISEPLPGNNDETELMFQMTGGEFSINPGADGLVNGTITYNVEQWEPEFTRSSNLFEIKQVNPLRISGIPSNKIENKWELSLTRNLPLNLNIEGGASDNDFNFTGLQLTNLTIKQGASDTSVRFDSPNPVVMEELSYTTGASSAKIFGLGYANFERMTMSGGAGDYTLDFTGSLSQDAVVDIKAGISNITIIIPSGMNAIINNEGTVSNINTEGTWLLTDETYTTMEEGITLTINLDLAVGNVNLIH
ncbi:MAG: toast rack family protein [Chloroflexota bacterium]|nr:toast rack family protein [Chloroflexota bacterium]